MHSAVAMQTVCCIFLLLLFFWIDVKSQKISRIVVFGVSSRWDICAPKIPWLLWNE